MSAEHKPVLLHAVCQQAYTHTSEPTPLSPTDNISRQGQGPAAVAAAAELAGCEAAVTEATAITAAASPADSLTTVPGQQTQLQQRHGMLLLPLLRVPW